MTTKRSLIAAAALILAAIFQMTLAFSLAIGTARPDFILTTIACLAALLGTTAGAGVGLAGGLLMAMVVGVNYGSFLVSRALTGVLSGWLSERFLSGLFTPPIMTFFATIFCEGVYYSMAPAHRGLGWIALVLLEALYNFALALPITYILLSAGIRPEQNRPLF